MQTSRTSRERCKVADLWECRMRALSASMNAGCEAPRVLESETALEDYWTVLEVAEG
jgi:hypothetical protein